MYIDRLIELIGKNHGGIVKSNFVNMYWIHQSTYFVHLHKEIFPNEEIVNKLYNIKHKCVKQMLKSGVNQVKIYKPSKDVFKWLIVLENELEGYKYSVVAPYSLYRDIVDIVDINELEETTENKDRVILHDREFYSGSYKKMEGIKLLKCMENMEKSRLKLIDKMNAEI
ncbi:MAG: hypothetical protein ACRCX2_19505 [Paraclostridium sp.]